MAVVAAEEYQADPAKFGILRAPDQCSRLPSLQVGAYAVSDYGRPLGVMIVAEADSFAESPHLFYTRQVEGRRQRLRVTLHYGNAIAYAESVTRQDSDRHETITQLSHVLRTGLA